MPPKRPLLQLNVKKNMDDDDALDHYSPGLGGDSQQKVPDCIVKATEHVFVSGLKAAYNLQQLKEHKIDVIISMIAQCDMDKYPGDFIYHDFPVSDNQSQDMSSVFDKISDLMLEYTSKGKNVLVHCREGISRAPTVVIAYLMRVNKQNFDYNFKILKDVSAKVDPNISFISQLHQFYKQLMEENN